MSQFVKNTAYFIPITTLSLIFLLLDVFYLKLERFNIWVRHVVNKTRVVKIKPFMVMTHRYNDFISASTQIAIVAMLLGFVWKDWKRGMFLTATLAVQTTVVTLTKRIAVRTRPPHVAAHKLMTSGSYPSGHAANTMAMFFLIPAFLAPHVSVTVVSVLGAYLFLNAILTAYGRLYLDVHWATDILGGWSLSGVTFLTAFYITRL